MSEKRPGQTYNLSAGRDVMGNIRLNDGTGLLVALKRNTRAEVQGWLDRSVNPNFSAQYAAALALFDREATA
ncbi:MULTISPECIES: hypothetical protein [Nocardia]|uniref:hypothetical protein n=1 Tax=Nocardia TaxID=1817 RepID=UPI000D6888B6|nr:MULTISPECIES: hypothetical protein [Nocardia]